MKINEEDLIKVSGGSGSSSSDQLYVETTPLDMNMTIEAFVTQYPQYLSTIESELKPYAALGINYDFVKKYTLNDALRFIKVAELQAKIDAVTGYVRG